MKKLLSFVLVLLMCASLFAGCGEYDMASADLESFVTLGNIESIEYEELVKHYNAYLKAQGESAKSFYLGTGYVLSFSLKAEVKNGEAYAAFADFTKDVENYRLYENTANSAFDKALATQLDDAGASGTTPRLIKKGEAFSFTMTVSENNANTAIAGKTFKFTVTVTEVIPSPYSDNELVTELQEFYQTYSASKEVIEAGDSVQIDYVGKIDGEAFEGGTANDQAFVVGEGGFIDGFEDQLIGHKNGETFDITVTFPEDYREEAYAGKEAVFTITVDDVSNDTSIITENTPFANIWELKEYYRIQRYIEYAIVDYVADISTLISLPEELVDDFRAIYKKEVERRITDMVLTYSENGEDYTKAEMKELLYPNGSDQTYIEEMAKDAAYNYIIVHLLVEKLGLTYSEKQYERDLLNIAEEYSSYFETAYSAKDVENLVGKEVLKLSFLDALVSPKLTKRITGAPVFGSDAE